MHLAMKRFCLLAAAAVVATVVATAKMRLTAGTWGFEVKCNGAFKLTVAGDAVSGTFNFNGDKDGYAACDLNITVPTDGEYTFNLFYHNRGTRHIAHAAWAMLALREQFGEDNPIRALHVRASNLVVPVDASQPRLFDIERDWEGLDRCIDDLRRRYGNKSIVRGCELLDPSLATVDIKDENTVHPVGYFHR